MRIFVVGDDNSFRGRFEGIISSEPGWCFVGGSGAAALQGMCALDADVIVIDADTTRLASLDTLPRFNRNGTKLKIVLVGAASEEIASLQVKLAVSGYAPKTSSRAKLVSEIRAAFRGGHYLSNHASRHLISDTDSDGLRKQTHKQLQQFGC